MAKSQPQPQPQMTTRLEDNNYYLFNTPFNSETCGNAIRFILEKSFLPPSERPKNITLIINSPGGQVHSALALIDTMNAVDIPIHTIGLGLIASCGILTFMSGEKGHRVITPNTSILSHQYSWGSNGKEHELFSIVKEFDLATERMMKLYKHCTGLSKKDIRKYLLPPEDVWLTADEAVKFNIADKIVNTYTE